MEQILGMLQDGASIVLEVAVLVGLLLLRNVKQHLEKFYAAKTLLEQRQLLAQLGREAFSYAETVHGSKDGPAKMNEAIKYMLEKCDDCGMKEVSMKDLRAVIESAWLENCRKADLPRRPERLSTGELR
jgi:predicted ArsR family transcriptional regulator